MVGISKKKKTQCDKCKQYFSNKQFKKHFDACDGKSKKKKEYTNCPYCWKEITTKNLKIHKSKCKVEHEAPELFIFLDYLFFLVIKINTWLIKNGLDNIFKKKIIHNKKLEYINKEINDENEKEMKINEEEENYMKSNYLKENKILLNSIIKNMNVDECENYIPLISFRQLIIDFTNNFNEGIKFRRKISFRVFTHIFKKYKKNDYKLNNEIENKIVFEIRKGSVFYEEKRNFLFGILKQYIIKRDKLCCRYCGKYVINKFQHLKACKGFKEKYETEKNETIKDVINTYLINDYQKSNKEITTIENEFENVKPNEFIQNIKVFLNKKKYRDFREKQKEQREYNNNNIFSILKNIENLKNKIKNRKINKYDFDENSEVPKEILDEINQRFEIKKRKRIVFKKIINKNELKDLSEEIDKQIKQEEINKKEEEKKKKFIINYMKDCDTKKKILNEMNDVICYNTDDEKSEKKEENNNEINYEENIKLLFSQKINEDKYNLINVGDDYFNTKEREAERRKLKEKIYINKLNIY